MLAIRNELHFNHLNTLVLLPLKNGKKTHVLIFDLSDGTSDVPFRMIKQGIFKMKATSDTQLRVKNFDNKLAGYVRASSRERLVML